MTIRQYYRGFASLYGAVTTLVGLFPLSSLVPQPLANYLFPPLPGIFGVGAFVMAALVTLVIYPSKDLACSQSRRRWYTGLCIILAAAAAGLIALLASWQTFVRYVEIPSKGMTVAVSVGYERSEFGKSGELGTMTDAEALRERGPWEEEIGRLWTPGSLILARLALFGSYLLFLLPVVAIGSLLVLRSGLGPAPHP